MSENLDPASPAEAADYRSLQETCGVFDLSARGRLCLVGADRTAFLNGQVTNQVKGLNTGSGCYAALVNARGKMQSDLRIYLLEDEILLDFEPGLSAMVAARLEKFVIAEDVQIVDASPHYGLLSFQGPLAATLADTLVDPACSKLGEHEIRKIENPALGSCYVARTTRIGIPGFDWFVPVGALAYASRTIEEPLKALDGRWCGMAAWETVRIENGVPRFSADMDENTLPPEAGLETRAVSYNKGCYIGQEVIARIRTYGEPARVLRGLTLSPAVSGALPERGSKLRREGKEIGWITSLVKSPKVGGMIALGYVRKEWKAIGSRLNWTSGSADGDALVEAQPFEPFGPKHRH